MSGEWVCVEIENILKSGVKISRKKLVSLLERLEEEYKTEADAGFFEDSYVGSMYSKIQLLHDTIIPLIKQTKRIF